MDSASSHLQQATPQSAVTGDDVLLSHFGVRPGYGWRSLRRGPFVDRLFDAQLAANPAFAAVKRNAATLPRRRVHIAGVVVPGREGDLQRVLAGLSSDRHTVTTTTVPMGDRGKFTNINLALAETDLTGVDWLIVTDDDIAFPAQFIDRFLYACERADLKVAQPAHRFRSHTTWTVTQRVWNSLVHLTNFVECGPVTAFHRDVFADVLPFPENRWAWGLDVLWAELARRRGLRIGVVDATPIEHLRPVAQTYDHSAALAEARELLARWGVRRSNRDVMVTTGVISRL